MTKEIVQVQPHVARITEGLRDTGYDLNMAIADLIDNSIEARATTVDVRFGLREDGSTVIGVGDNGLGMNREALINAMRYGSDPKYTDLALSKFGLGLKTASTSFCKRLILVSRDSADAPALRAVWDLDDLAESGEWNLEIGDPTAQELDYLNLYAPNHSGTAVIWEKIDRIFTKQEDDITLQTQVLRITEELEEHLGLVFQRFIETSDTRAPNICLKVNDKVITPWNPLMPILGTQIERQILNATINDEIVPIYIEATILPRPEEIPSNELRTLTKLHTETQGIYVYRENRLIHGPDWLGIFPQEPHYTLLRLAISFDKRMDNSFMVDIKKSRVLINEHLYKWLKHDFLPQPLQEAESRWRKGMAEEANLTAVQRHKPSDTAIAAHLYEFELPQILAIYPETNTVRLSNNNSMVSVNMKVVNDSSHELSYITTATSLENGALYEPALINGAFGLALNTGHPFYSKAYMQNEKNTSIIQALDLLLWSLAQAEVNNTSETSKADFEESRLEISRHLKKLLSFLPEN